MRGSNEKCNVVLHGQMVWNMCDQAGMYGFVYCDIPGKNKYIYIYFNTTFVPQTKSEVSTLLHSFSIENLRIFVYQTPLPI
jgi:hypothetical protein